MKKKKILSNCAAALWIYCSGHHCRPVYPVRAFSEMENRELKTTSRFTLSRLFRGDFQSRYEEVVADQFVGRGRMDYPHIHDRICPAQD